jgi:Tfp pilus assembly PilM family ATPase/Tfp pilus assembly protein PilN
MKRLDFMNSPCLYLEIGQSSLKALLGNDGLELTIERLPNGRLTEPCKERLAFGLRDFLQKKNWQARSGAFCAVGARGVSLRRMSLPAGNREATAGLLRLQIEREFPLPPDELAWGYYSVDGQGSVAGQQELVVAAAKKEILDEYSALLSGCGINPVYTLAALDRGNLCFHPSGAHALLDIGRNHSELISFQNGAPVSLRILPWGDESMTQAIWDKLNISRDEAENLKANLDKNGVFTGELGKQVQNAVAGALDMLAAAIKSNWNGEKLYLSGKSAGQKDLTSYLSRALGGRVECERLELARGEGRSAAILGLKKVCEQEGGAPKLTIQLNGSGEIVRVTRPAPWKWAAVTAALVLGVALFPFAEALLLKPRLAKKLSEIAAAKDKLAAIDQDLGFLQYIKLNQPPYLEATYLMADAAPNGTQFEALSMNHQGEVSMRGSMQGSQQVVDFREKLIKSGFFSAVTVEEQAPTQDRQKVNVRITAQWKPASARESLVMGPSKEEIEKLKAAAKENQSGMPGGMPGGLPPGITLPPGVVLPPGFSFPGGD